MARYGVRMVRRPPSPPVTAQMYRHFAVVTVAVTAAIGLFADGESRKAVAREVGPAAPPALAGPTTIVRHDTAPRGSFAADDSFDGAFGAPMDAAGAAAHDGVVPVTDTEGRGVPAGFTRYGISAEAWAALTDAQRAALAAKRAAEDQAASAADRGAQIANLMSQSRARSGEATAAD